MQRIQELGNYRNLALLGLPLALAEGARLVDLERRLADIADRIAGASTGTEAALLDDLCDLAAIVAATSAATGFA